MGARWFRMLRMAGQIVFLFLDIVRCLFRYPIRFPLLVKQIDFIGGKSLPVVIITGSFIGAVFAAQTEFQFKSLGPEFRRRAGRGHRHVPRTRARAVRADDRGPRRLGHGGGTGHDEDHRADRRAALAGGLSRRNT